MNFTNIIYSCNQRQWVYEATYFLCVAKSVCVCLGGVCVLKSAPPPIQSARGPLPTPLIYHLWKSIHETNSLNRKDHKDYTICPQKCRHIRNASYIYVMLNSQFFIHYSLRRNGWLSVYGGRKPSTVPGRPRGSASGRKTAWTGLWILAATTLAIVFHICVDS